MVRGHCNGGAIRHARFGGIATNAPTSVTRHGCSGPPPPPNRGGRRSGLAYPRTVDHMPDPGDLMGPHLGVHPQARPVLSDGLQPPATGDPLPRRADWKSIWTDERARVGKSKPAVSTTRSHDFGLNPPFRGVCFPDDRTSSGAHLPVHGCSDWHHGSPVGSSHRGVPVALHQIERRPSFVWPGDPLRCQQGSMGGHCGRSAVPVVCRAAEGLKAEPDGDGSPAG